MIFEYRINSRVQFALHLVCIRFRSVYENVLRKYTSLELQILKECIYFTYLFLLNAKKLKLLSKTVYKY